MEIDITKLYITLDDLDLHFTVDLDKIQDVATAFLLKIMPFLFLFCFSSQVVFKGENCADAIL